MNPLSHKTWHEKLASLLKHQLLPERVVIKNWHTYQCWQHTGFTNALFWAAVIKVILPFKRDGMLVWRASMLGLAAAAKEEKRHILANKANLPSLPGRPLKNNLLG